VPIKAVAIVPNNVATYSGGIGGGTCLKLAVKLPKSLTLRSSYRISHICNTPHQSYLLQLFTIAAPSPCPLNYFDVCLRNRPGVCILNNDRRSHH
jgi:hypothetical protein